MKWVTRERPKIDRIACPWLIARFIDREPEFLFVPPGEVLATARDRNAIPYDVPDVELTHVGHVIRDGVAIARSGERSEEHTSELQSQSDVVCRLLREDRNGLESLDLR